MISMEVSGKRSDITEVGADEELEKLCEVCEVDHVTTKANGICRECEQFMCDTCFTTHIKVKSCRQHVLVDTDQYTTPALRSLEDVEICKRHANEKIKYYCRKHEAVGCGDCMIPEHFSCRPENIKDLSKAFKENEDFKSLMIKLENIQSANKENDQKVQDSKKASADMLEKALKKIKTFRSEINSYLDKAESNIIKEAKGIECKNDNLMTKLEQDCKQVNSKITEMRQKLDKELYQDSALFIQTVNCKPRVLHIEQEVARIQKENDIETLAFIPDKQVQDIITSIAKLGSLDKNRSPSFTKTNKGRLTDEVLVGREASSSHVKERKPDKEKKEKAQEPVKRVDYGARVRPIGDYLLHEYRWHEGQPGTVTAVNSEEYVDVLWDATGCTGITRRIGVHIELI